MYECTGIPKKKRWMLSVYTINSERDIFVILLHFNQLCEQASEVLKYSQPLKNLDFKKQKSDYCMT